MLNIINKMFNRSTVTTTKPDDRDIFTRISIHHDKNVRKVNKTTVVRLQGNKKEAVVEVLRKGIPMTARELANVTGFKLSYITSALQYDSKNLPNSRVFKKAGHRKCMFSGNVCILYKLV